MQRACRRLCPAAHFLRLLRLLPLENDEFTRETGHVWPLRRAWQCDSEAAAGELERDSALKDLALRGGCSRADRQIYLCLFA